MKFCFRAIAPALMLAGLGAAPAAAQEMDPRYSNVISANPFGLLIGWFNAEYERQISESATAGIGGSFAEDDDIDYANADVFFRYYPQGKPYEGWSFGGKLGVTRVPDQDTYFGYGFDVNRSWLMGKNKNFYVGVGFGLKRLVGVDEDDVDNPDETLFTQQYVPTFRIINVGFAF